MIKPNGAVSTNWLKLVAAAAFIGVYPGTLYRHWRYGQRPEGTCVKGNNTLYFNRGELKQIQITNTAAKGQLRRRKSND